MTTVHEHGFADFDDFVARTRPGMLARAVMYCGRREEAEDAVQEAYVAAFLHWGGLREPRAWVAQTMRRKFARDAGRWWSRWRHTELELPAPAAAAPEEEAAAVAVLRTVALLPPRQRQVLIMVCLEGLSYRQVSDEIGISVGAVGANLVKARQKLTVLLGLTPEPGDPGDPLVAASPAGTLIGDPLAGLLRRTESWLVAGFAEEAER
ncbi:sigma-70 family RNA polymerase sigma factor [Actinoplanes sp. NPDC023801]|uniref:RNA polymerase sigma factor n=1 Tax=Actinoplanes sp. NPDC023801 TaxID=3154595 RepID=UPI003407FC40